jgi:hypothetical protein
MHSFLNFWQCFDKAQLLLHYELDCKFYFRGPLNCPAGAAYHYGELSS